MSNNLGKFAYAGVIGAIVSVIAMFVVLQIVENPDQYVAVGCAGFFGAFFACMFSGQKQQVEV